MRTLLFAAGVSLMVSLLGTKVLIDVLTRRRIGQPIREDGPQGHTTKAGTPTMGGAAIVGRGRGRATWPPTSPTAESSPDRAWS